MYILSENKILNWTLGRDTFRGILLLYSFKNGNIGNKVGTLVVETLSALPVLVIIDKK